MTYAAEVLADAPLAWYRLDEASGTSAADSSGNGRAAAALTGAVTPNAPSVLPKPGASGASADFGGGYASVPDAAWMQGATLSAEAWFVADTVTGDRPLVAKTDWDQPNSGALRRFHLFVKDGKVGAQVSTDAANAEIFSAAGAVATGLPYHAAVTHDGTTLRLYLNGAEVANAALAGSAHAAAGVPLSIGTDSVRHYGNFDGRVDDVAYYGTALSAARVAAHYRAGATGRDVYLATVQADAPWGLWMAEDAAGATSLADSSGNGRALAITGAPTLAQAGPSDSKAVAWPTSADATEDYAGSAATLATEAATFETWVLLGALPANLTPIVGCGVGYGGNSHDKVLRITPQGKVQWMVYTGGSVGTDTTAADALSLDVWHHIAVSVGAAGAKVRVDGATVATTPAATTSYSGAQNVFIHGAGSNGNSPNTDGGAVTIGPSAVWASQLTDAQTDAHRAAMGYAPPVIVPPGTPQGDTYDTSPFSRVWPDSGTWGRANGALVQTDSGSTLRVASYDALPNTPTLDFAADVTLTSDSAGLRHFGLFAVCGWDLYPYGFRVGRYQGDWVVTRYNGNNAGSVNVATTVVTPPAALAVGETHRLRMVIDFASGAGSLYVDGVLAITWTDASFARGRGGFWSYGNQVAWDNVRDARASADDTFDTSPITGSRVVSLGAWAWDGTAKALLAYDPNTNARYAFRKDIARSAALDTEVDITLVRDAQGRRHAGFFLQSVDGAAATGLRIVSLDGGWILSRFQDGAEVQAIATIAGSPLVPGTASRARVRWDAASSTGTLWVNGIKRGDFTVSGFTSSLRPGFFSYGSTTLFDNSTPLPTPPPPPDPNPSVANLRLVKATYTSLRFDWDPAPGGGTPSYSADSGNLPSSVTYPAGQPPTIVAQADTTNGTAKAIQPADLGDGTSAWYEFPVTSGEGAMSFRWQMQSEGNYDKGYIQVDGVYVVRDVSGYYDWQTSSIDVEAGSHIIRVTYNKDGSASNGYDNFRISRVTIPGSAVGGTQYRVDGGAPQAATGTSVVLTGLQPGTDHTIEVRTDVGAGYGPWVAATGSTPAIGPYVAAVIADAPWAYYRMDDPAGATTLTDSSGNDRTASLSGAAAGYDQAALAPNLARGLRLDGQWIGLPNGFTGGDATFEFWWQPTTLLSINDLLSVDGESRITRSGDAGIPAGRLQVSFGNNRSQMNSDIFAVGVLHHVVMRYVASTGVVTVFVDGSPVFTATQNANGWVGTTVRMLYGSYGDRIARGYFSDVAFYKTPLSDARVAAHWAVTQPEPVQGLAVTGTTDTTATLAWTTPGLSGPVTQAQYRVAGGPAQAVPGNASPLTVTGLVPTSTRLIEVRVSYGAGWSAWRGATATMTGDPAALTYSQRVLVDNPLAYYKHDGAPGSAVMADSSGQGRDGAYAGAVTLGATGLVPGQGTAGAYGGGSARGRVPYDAAWMDPAALTYEMWLRPSAVGGTQHLLGRNGPNSYQAILRLQTLNSVPGVPYFIVNVGGNYYDVSAPARALTVGQLAYLVGTYDGSTMRLYVNGTEVANRALSGTPNKAASPLTVGGNGVDDTESFAGTIDEVAFYGTALPASRIAARYDSAGISGDAQPVVGAVDARVLRAVVASAPLRVASADVKLLHQSDPIPLRVSSADIKLLHAAAIVGEDTAVGGIDARVLRAPAVPELRTGSIETKLLHASVPTRTPTEESREAGRRRRGIATTTWAPPISVPEAGIQAVYELNQQFVAPSMAHDTMPQIELTQHRKRQYRIRTVIGGVDVSFYRGIPTPEPDYQLQEPLLYGPASVSMPQVVPAYEKLGEGSLTWARTGAPVVLQLVDDLSNTVIRTVYRGVVVAFDTSGPTLGIEIGGEATGRAALQERPVPLFIRRNDLGFWWWGLLKDLRLELQPRLGPNTGILLRNAGGMTYLEYAEQLSTKGQTRAGELWTCMPGDDGVYRLGFKDTTTIHGTVYPDDARTVAQLRHDVAEQPNEVYATGVAPSGMRVKFGAYPILQDGRVAPYPYNDKTRVIEPGTTDAGTDTGDGITIMLWRLQKTGYVSFEDKPGGYDADAQEGIRNLKRDAGIYDNTGGGTQFGIQNGKMTWEAWKALFDVSATGYSIAGAKILPAASDPRTDPWRRSGSGGVIGTNPRYEADRLVVSRSVDMGVDLTRQQMRRFAQRIVDDNLVRAWTGTIAFNTGGLVRGNHTPGVQLSNGTFMSARELRPGMNLRLPHFDGGITVHVSAISVSGGTVTATVDTRARDAMEVWEVIARNKESRRDPARSWYRAHRSSALDKDAITEFDEIGGVLEDGLDLQGGDWNIFPIVAGQEGTIARLRLQTTPASRFAVAVFGDRIRPGRLRQLVGNPLATNARARWVNESVRATLTDEYYMLYAAGDINAPCGYWPKSLSQDQSPGLTGKWNDDAGFGYRAIRGAVLWIAVWPDRNTRLQRGRVMWPQLEAGS